MTHLTRRYMDGPFGQLHVVEAGLDQGPTVLLLHQTPRSWDEFREVMIALSDRFHLVAMDLPGMGGSDPHPDGATIERYAEAAAAVLAGLADTPFAVCGHHTGGVVGIELGASRPDLVDRLVLSSTPWVDAAARAARASTAPIDTIKRHSSGQHLLDLWAQRAPFYSNDTGLLDRFLSDAMRCEDPATGHHAVSRYLMEQAVTRVICPVTIIEHSSDPFASKHTADLQRAFGSAPVLVIPDGGVALEATAHQFSRHLQHALTN